MSDYQKIVNILMNYKIERRSKDAIRILDIIRETIHVEPDLWEDKFPGFGTYHYINKTNEGDMPILSLALAKAHVTLYFAVEGLDPYKHYLEKIGQHRRGKICLYISNLDKIDLDIFKALISESYDNALKKKFELGR